MTMLHRRNARLQLTRFLWWPRPWPCLPLRPAPKNHPKRRNPLLPQNLKRNLRKRSPGPSCTPSIAIVVIPSATHRKGPRNNGKPSCCNMRTRANLPASQARAILKFLPKPLSYAAGEGRREEAPLFLKLALVGAYLLLGGIALSRRSDPRDLISVRSRCISLQPYHNA